MSTTEREHGLVTVPPMSTASNPVVIIGAGPAGLAAARELGMRGITPTIFERGEHPGHSWRNVYDSLTLHTGRHLSALPGMRFPAGTPLFPRRRDFIDYLDAYARRFAPNIETGVDVQRLEFTDGSPSWRVQTSNGTVDADVVIVATGIMANPVVPTFPGRESYGGEVIHSIAYRRPAPFLGRRVLVVGVGNSGGEIGSELANAGVDVAIAVRSGANVVPLTIAGVPIQYVAYGLRRLPRPLRMRIADAVGRLTEARRGPPVLPKPDYGPLDAIPLIGFHLVDAISAGRIRVRPGIASFTRTGVRFTDGSEEDFDTVILATGFRPALQPLGGLVRTDAKGFALRSDRVTSADRPGLYFVGHNYDAGGGLMNINRDSRIVARALRRARSHRG